MKNPAANDKGNQKLQNPFRNLARTFATIVKIGKCCHA